MQPTRNLSHLLKTNVPPTHTEAASVTERLGGLRNEILQIEAQLQALRKEETMHLAILSPVRLIPAEILGQIFLLATPEVCDRKAVINVRDFCLVCKIWRDAAFLMRRGWSSLSFTPGDLAGPDAYNSIVIWLSRAGKLPKWIEFHGKEKHCDCRGGPCTTNDPVLQKLVKEGPALHHLGLELVSINCLRSFMASMKDSDDGSLGSCPLDSLASLDLAFCDVPPEEYEHLAEDPGAFPLVWWDDWDINPSESALSYIPSSITSLGLHLPAQYYAFPEEIDSDDVQLHVDPTVLRHLTVLTIRCDWMGDHLLNTLKHCVNLEDLTMDFNGESLNQYEDLSSSDTKSPLVLPTVRRLRLRNAEVLHFLNCITIPAIEELDLGMDGRGGQSNETFCDEVQTFLRRSQRLDGLQSLRIYNLRFPSGNLAPAFSEIPTLRRLTLDKARFDVRSTIHTLWMKATSSISYRELKTMPISNSPLFPCLERLELLSVPPDFPFKEVIRFLGKRHDPPFCHVVGQYGGQMARSPSEADFNIDTLRKSGLSFTIVPSTN